MSQLGRTGDCFDVRFGIAARSDGGVRLGARGTLTFAPGCVTVTGPAAEPTAAHQVDPGQSRAYYDQANRLVSLQLPDDRWLVARLCSRDRRKLLSLIAAVLDSYGPRAQAARLRSMSGGQKAVLASGLVCAGAAAATVIALSVAGVIGQTPAERSQELFERGEWDQATRLAVERLAKHPDDVQAHRALATVLAWEGRYDEALAHLRHALQLDPDLPTAHTQMGQLLMQVGRPEEAVRHLRRALQLAPTSAEAFEAMGNALSMLGKPREAIDCYRRAIEIWPDRPQAHSGMGVALARVGDMDRAAEAFRRGLALNPADPRAHYHLGLALLKIGRTQEAVAHLRQARELASDDTELLRLIDKALEQAQLRKKAPASAPATGPKE